MTNKKAMHILVAVGALLLMVMAGILLSMILSGEREADTETTSPETQRSPTDIARAYFDAWNNQSIPDMEALMIAEDRHQNMDYDVMMVDHVEPLRIEEEPVPKDAAYPFMEDAHAVACVRADFTVYYNDRGQDFYQQESVTLTDFMFWLVREEAGSEWLIAMQGY